MTFDPASHFRFAEDARKVGLLYEMPNVAEPKPVIIAVLLEVTENTLVLGTHAEKDLFRTVFDRHTGKSIGEGRLAQLTISKTELDRIEDFALQGAYAAPVPTFDPDAMV